MIDTALQGFGAVQQWLFEAVVQPVVFGLGGASILAEAFNATGWLLVGLLQLAVMLLGIGALQRWRPIEPVTDRAAVRTGGVPSGDSASRRWAAPARTRRGSHGV